MRDARRAKCQFCDFSYSERNLRTVPTGGVVCKDSIGCQIRHDAAKGRIQRRSTS